MRPNVPVQRQCAAPSAATCGTVNEEKARPYHTLSKFLSCANVRCKLTDTAAARLTLQRLWTNSPRRLLYAGPTLLVAPGGGTISWRSLVFLLNRARDTRNSFGRSMTSVSSGIRLNGIDRKSANPLRSAIIHDSTSMTATRRKNLAFRSPFVQSWTSCDGH